MMLFKLSVRNLKKSIQDYMIYFATLILGVAIFYVFNALESQSIMMKVSSSTYEIIKVMNKSLSVVSVFVSFVLGFLIVYASNFLMRRRKKEFGIYMLLGMGKRKISIIILIETVLIGVISLVVGLALGIIASQGMSIVVANMFEADMTKYSFIISPMAVGKTVLYFLAMYLVVLFLDTFVVGKAKLIDLINAGKKSEKNVAKNTWLCLLVFTAACILLGTAYYKVTANAENMVDSYEMIIQIIKGIVATFLIFWSLSGLLMYMAKKNKRLYYRGVNSFTVKELGSRINTTVFSGSIICLMLFMTICILSSAMSVKKAINDNLVALTPIDVNFTMESNGGKKISDVFESTGVDTTIFKDVVDICSYQSKSEEFTIGSANGRYMNELDKNMSSYLKKLPEAVVKLSDYNKAARLYGIQEYTLSEDEYLIIADFDMMVDIRNQALKTGYRITIGEKEYHPKYASCQNGYILMASHYTNYGFIVVPDSADLKDFQVYDNYYLANYHATGEEEIKKIENYIDSKQFQTKLNPKGKSWSDIFVNSKTYIYASSIGLRGLVVFIGVYLGIVFMISGAAILALKELSEASDNREKYRILRSIGVDEKMIYQSLFSQCAMFFGLPLLVAGIHSIFGIQTCVTILETFGTTGLLFAIITTAAIIVSVYGVYFTLTYLCSKKIISEN